MSVIVKDKGLVHLDMTDEVRAVDEFLNDSTPERKVAVVAWYLRMMERLEPEVVRGLLDGARQLNAKLQQQILPT